MALGYALVGDGDDFELGGELAQDFEDLATGCVLEFEIEYDEVDGPLVLLEGLYSAAGVDGSQYDIMVVFELAFERVTRHEACVDEQDGPGGVMGHDTGSFWLVCAGGIARSGSYERFSLQWRRGKRQVQQRIIGVLIPYSDDPHYEIKQ